MMRAGGCFLCVLCLGATCAIAQVADESFQTEPYNKHYDRHLGHDHAYPDRGAIFRDPPRGSTVVNYAGLSYRFSNGIWLEPRGPAFIVVMPPIGLLVPSLPSFATPFESGGKSYLYANDVYYLPRPELGGYEVVNDPIDAQPAVAERASPASGPVRASAPAGVTPAAVAATAVAPTGGPTSSSVAVTPIGLPAPSSAVTATSGSASAPASAGAAAATIPASSGPAAPTVVPAAPAAGVTAPASLPTPAASSATTSVASGSPAVVTGPTSASPVVSTVGTGTTVAGGALASVASTAAPASSTATPSVAGAAAGSALPAAPPATSAAAVVSNPPLGIKVTAYPRNGQSPDQQARDQYDCYAFGVAQSGFDPLRARNGAASAGITAEVEFARARAACYESRGYTLQ